MQRGAIISQVKIAISKINEYFQLLDIKIKLSDYTDNYQATAQEIHKRFTERGWMAIGEHGKITPSDVKKIVEMSY